MKVKEIYVKVYSKGEYPIYLGGMLLDCGIEIFGIHFTLKGKFLYINYPAIRDKTGRFHPSFSILNSTEDQKIQKLLKDAWERAVEKGKSVYGYNVNGQEMIWTDERLEECEKITLLTDLRTMPIKIQSSCTHQGINGRKTIYVRICIDDQVLINNIKVIQIGTDKLEIRFPKHGIYEVICIRNDIDRKWLRQYITEHVLKREKSFDRENEITVTPDSSEANILNKKVKEEKMFQILWDASDNGYILQSKIRSILEENGIDWQNEYQVQHIAQLIEKMDFMSVRRLETKPEHFVDWVAISHEKDPENQTSDIEKRTIISDSLKGELHDALYKKYNAEGKINLAEVIPYLQDQFPKLFGQLPRLKLKVILKSCDFVTFEGGPMPPIYIHIMNLNSGQTDTDMEFSERKLTEQELLSENLNYDITENVTEKNISDEQSQLDEGKKGNNSSCVEKSIKNEKHMASANPFTYVKNTKLLLEAKLPDSKVSLVNSDEALRKLLSMTSSGILDSMDLELVYWISNLQYAKSTFLYDLIIGGFIPIPPAKTISKDKLNKRLIRLYKLKLIEFYKLCSVNEVGTITGKASHRILMLTGFGRTQLKMIGRRSTFDYFMPLDNIEKILNKLSVNQWFTKFIMLFKDAIYFFDTVLTAKIAEANAARISLIVNKDGIPIFIRAFKRGSLHNDDIRSGEFDFWIKRVSTLLENYQKLYIEAKRVEYRKIPKIVFICEDMEHCQEIYRQMQYTTERIGNFVFLDNLWFAEDLKIYNDFLHAHFRIDTDMGMIPVDLEEFLETSVNASELEAEYDPGDEEDTMILAELNDDDRVI